METVELNNTNEALELRVEIGGMPDLPDAAPRVSGWMGVVAYVRLWGQSTPMAMGRVSLLVHVVAYVLFITVPLVGAFLALKWLCGLLGWGENGFGCLLGLALHMWLVALVLFGEWLWPHQRHSTWALIGADGVLLCQARDNPPKANHIFLPYSAIKQIETFQGDVEYGDGDGYSSSIQGVELMLISGQLFTLYLQKYQVADIYRRLCEARDRCQAIVCDDAELFRRDDRSLEEWLNALDMLSSSSNQVYREPSIGSDRLWHVIEAQSANPTARAGAAIALLKQARMIDSVDRERLLAAASSAVAPGLRDAFRAVASTSSNEALSSVLAAIEEPTQGSR